ncbi:glycine N-methyltransferase isoform X1 [Bacillus rossius redtenbacheri]|uniref:glycine N-methyltransferase isoform X1 n=1 Tax=Bacillus rossius redtenbacheri TaxID=93214 RepID=UPI002FDEC351
MAAALYLPRHATPRQSPAARLASHSAASSDMADSVFHTRTQGTPAEGLRDQYADGKAARVWEVFIGDKNSRTRHYRNFLVGLLRRNNCRTVLDVACGTGIDSIMLLEEGFKVTSVDASDKMLKHALKSRWERRREKAFDEWVIEEANWLTLTEDLGGAADGFDAVLCLGNSFAHMPDPTGDQHDIRLALRNFRQCVKPGGLLLIDHRNYDHILDLGYTPSKCIYYNSQHMTDIVTSVLYVNGRPSLVTLDYMIDISERRDKSADDPISEDSISQFRLSYYPHRLEAFKDMLRETFCPLTRHTIYGDFKPLDEIEDPAFYIHVMQTPRLS